MKNSHTFWFYFWLATLPLTNCTENDNSCPNFRNDDYLSLKSVIESSCLLLQESVWSWQREAGPWWLKINAKAFLLGSYYTRHYIQQFCYIFLGVMGSLRREEFSLLLLPLDVVGVIAEYLNSRDNISFLNISKQWMWMKKQLLYWNLNKNSSL